MLNTVADSPLRLLAYQVESISGPLANMAGIHALVFHSLLLLLSGSRCFSHRDRHCNNAIYSMTFHLLKSAFRVSSVCFSFALPGKASYLFSVVLVHAVNATTAKLKIDFS